MASELPRDRISLWLQRRELRLAALVVAGLALLGLVGLAIARGGATRSADLTLGLPAAVNDRIYGAPEARGRPIVVIDAGHGGTDPGASGVSGEVREKDLTLTFARELRDLLVKRGRVRVAMTRDRDLYLPLDARAAVARRLDGALFVSLHMDSAANPLARGASVYSLSDVASDAEAARVAQLVNRGADGDRDADGAVETILADLAVRSRMRESAGLAARIVDQAAGRLELRPQPHKFAAFYVLRGAEAPAILFEAGYLSNAEDEVLLRDPRYRQRLALALAGAIERDIAARSVR